MESTQGGERAICRGRAAAPEPEHRGPRPPGGVAAALHGGIRLCRQPGGGLDQFRSGHRRLDLPPGRRPGGVAGLSGRHRRRLTRDTPSHLGRLGVTWPYRGDVLDLEPHGPLPTQIYWRRRALALGIAVLAIAVVAAVVVMAGMNS